MHTDGWYRNKNTSPTNLTIQQKCCQYNFDNAYPRFMNFLHTLTEALNIAAHETERSIVDASDYIQLQVLVNDRRNEPSSQYGKEAVPQMRVQSARYLKSD